MNAPVNAPANEPRAWPRVSDRVRALHARMTLPEKLAQLVGFWLDHGGEVVAPLADELGAADGRRLEEITADGLGHYSRVFGTRPVDPAERANWLRTEQDRLRRETRLGIPALVHEECLTGLAAWRAAAYPAPTAWGATFDPELVEEMATVIGEDMARLGVHQGLAPVLDVIRDPRWGRTEEAIAEDPYLVGSIGAGYVRGLQSAGVHATLKHFLGYSGSRAGRNHAPVSVGPRELAEVYAVPFEIALRDGGARSVMNSYSDLDGVPAAADEELFTGLLRERWGFDGVVVADYFAVVFLTLMHAVAADRGEAAELALRAGIDVELPTGDAYLEPLRKRIESGTTPEALVDRAVLRVLAQKEDLGLLDPVSLPPDSGPIDLDSPRHRDLARRVAEESVVLLSNDGTLPLARPERIAVIGPNADRGEALLGCYSFVNHVLASHPDAPAGIELPTVLQALRGELEDARVDHVVGCTVTGGDTSGFGAAREAARSADVAVVVAGDQAGLFGRGTVGEGNDVESLELPGVQRALVEEVVATGTPVVLVLVTGRPYALGWALDGERAPAAVVQAFFPGEEGGPAIARVLTGETEPSGRLPVGLPRSAGAQPGTYLQPLLGGPSEVSSADPTPVRPFGFGLGYTRFLHRGLRVSPTATTDGYITAEVTVSNVGTRRGTDVVQLYGRDRVASVVRPAVQLIGYARVPLEPGESARVRFTVPTGRIALVDRDLERVVEPGEIEVWAAAHAAERRVRAVAEGIATEPAAAAEEDGVEVGVVTLTGPVHRITGHDERLTRVRVE